MLFGSMVAVGIGMGLVLVPAAATPIHNIFDARLLTGPLAGTTFDGSFSYDDAGVTGINTEFLQLTSLNFTVFGVPFTLADVKQGGQAILEHGVVAFFTAAFLPPPPAGVPVSDLAFGFGDPGVIGYAVPPGFSDFGSGEYIVHPGAAPGLSSLACLFFGLVTLLVWRRRATAEGPLRF